MGMKVGYVLRSYVEREEGSIFTGGVEGVGVDVYTGVTRFCIDEGIRRGELLEDGFFVLIPENIEVGSKETYRTMKYNPPDSYEALAQLSRRRELDIVRAGANMNERREKVAEVADVIITVNGGMGTLDEAVNALKLSKRVITLPYTGGAARVLDKLRNPIGRRIRLASCGFGDVNVDFDLIIPASSSEEMLAHL